MSKTKIGVLIVCVLLVFYLVLTFQRGVILIADANWLAKGMGLALLLLPVVGAWALVRELMFGSRTERLAKILGAEGGLPPDDLPRTPAGRIVRKAADEAFAEYAREAEAEPDDWRSWFRLSCAYDASGDRRRARETMRKAIALERS